MKWILGVVGAAFVVSAASAQTPAAKAASQGVYTGAQATQGATVYAAHCASCHGPSMGGQDVTPALTGASFTSGWTGKPISELSDRIRTSMPMDNPGSLGLGDTALLLAAILQANGYPAGATDLPSSPSAQKTVMIDALTK
jgi:S-disulfanyl-L-cysteine oxidoreductase SoxD